MAGHNKWSKIRHRKAAVEKKKTKAWTKIAKTIIVAARHGGPDPNSNLALRYAMDEARYANMPRDTVDRAIRKGAGGEDTSDYENIRYEGYAPGGVAIIIDALTDNRARTVGDVRLAFSDHDGNVGASGCVAYMFQPRGQIVISGDGLTDESVMNAAIEAGAIDVESMTEEGSDETPSWMVLTDPSNFAQVKVALEKAKLPIANAALGFVPETFVAVTGEHATLISNLIDALEDLDDVQKVYTNAEFA